jgi:chemotaxis methyl-accepting protein methylase
LWKMEELKMIKDQQLTGSRIAGFLRRCLRFYILQTKRVWRHLPVSLRRGSLGQVFGRHLHDVVRVSAERRQYFGTFFMRNRAELELMRRLVHHSDSSLRIAVLACSKGAEVYSIMWAIRSARPDLSVCMHALDISPEILDFAEKGLYSLGSIDGSGSMIDGSEDGDEVAWNTHREQNAPIFERMTGEEVSEMCEVEGDRGRIRPWLREGITWVRGDAGDPDLVKLLGPQDIVVANRFLCHMTPAAAERCLRNVARLVKPGGFIFVSGVDLNVRTRVAQTMGWKPVADLRREIHEGDSSLRQGWPLEYWGLEPLREHRRDWKVRYASVFQIGETSRSAPGAA